MGRGIWGSAICLGLCVLAPAPASAEESAGTPVPPVMPASPPPPPAFVRGMPLLHIESDYPDVELSRVDGTLGGMPGSGAYQNNLITHYVCRPPCDRFVDGREGNRFLITGPGMLPSIGFRLDELEGPVIARVHGRSMARFTGGILLTTFGGMFSLGGTALFVVGSVVPLPQTTQGPTQESPGLVLTVAGGAMLALGVAALVGGIYLVSEGTTRVELLRAKKRSGGVFLENGALRF